MTKALHECKMAEDALVSSHVIKMIGYIENLERLGFPYNRDLAIDIILQSLPPSYSSFIMNYNMNGLEKSLTELHGMLKTAEQNIKHKTLMSCWCRKERKPRRSERQRVRVMLKLRARAKTASLRSLPSLLVQPASTTKMLVIGRGIAQNTDRKS